MSDYLEILEEMPEELRGPMGRLMQRLEDRLIARLAVRREDFIELRRAVEELAEAQARTERKVEELAEAQARTERALLTFSREFTAKVGAMGARWGLASESAFREAMRGILKDVGLEVRRYLAYDDEGMVFGHPEQIEIDVVVRDDATYLVEIKSSASRGDVATFARKVKFYEEKEKATVQRKLLVAPFLDVGARDTAEKFGIEVYTEVEDLEEGR